MRINKIIGIVCILTLGIIIGTKTKDCPIIECKECSEIYEVIDLKKDSLKYETIEKINAIDSAAIHELDSIWSKYRERYGKN